MYISWQEKYETGHALIDAQHKLLVFLFKKLDAAIKTRQPDARLARIVLEVRKFVEFHFISEENLMHEAGYGAIDSHRELHASLLLELNATIEKVNSERKPSDDLPFFLNKWLIDHIGDHDKLVAAHVRDSIERPVAELFYLEYFQAPSPAGPAAS